MLIGKYLIKLFIKNSDDTGNPQIRGKHGILAGIVGICCNLLLFCIKFFAGTMTASIAITADSFNNLSDAGSSAVTLVGFKMAERPADNGHPFGHGRFEYISGLIVSMVIILVGFELVKSSFDKIIHPEPVVFSVTALFILIFSICVKLWMCFFNKGIAAKINSTAMKATAMDSLSDAIATSTVVISMIITLITNISIDGYAGLAVACFIIYTGITTARDTLDPLLGQAPDSEFVKEIEETVLSYDSILGIHDLIVHNYGPSRCLISLHAEVSCDVDILVIHDTIDNIERHLSHKFSCEVVIHMDPIVTNNQLLSETHEKISALVKIIDESICIHDFRMVEGATHTNLIFDIVVPYRFRLNDEDVIKSVSSAVKVLDPKYEVVITVDKAFA